MKLAIKALMPVAFILLASGCVMIFLFWNYLGGQLSEDFFVSYSNKAMRSAEQFLTDKDFSDPSSSVSQRHFESFFQSLNIEEITNIILWNSSGEIVMKKIDHINELEKEDSLRIIQRENMRKPVFIKNNPAQEESMKEIPKSYQYNYKIYTPIFLGGKFSGVAELHLSDVFISQIIKRISFAAGVFFFFIFILAFVLIGIFLRRLIINPINQLVAASAALRCSDWDMPLKIRNKKDEISDLSCSFENMRSSLKNLFLKIKSKQEIAQRAEEKANMANKSLKAERDREEGILRYLHAIDEGVVATDNLGKITFVNLTAAKAIFYEEGSPLVGRKYLNEFIFSCGKDSGKKTIDPVKLAIKRKGVYVLPRGCFLIASSKEIPIAGSFAPIIKDENILGVVGVFQDITERINIEKEKDDFISIAAHQLRTPLTGIRWMIEMILEDKRISSEAKEYLRLISENNQRLIVLVNDLLDVSRINMGSSKEDPSLVSVSAIIKEALKPLESLVKDRGIKVSYRMDDKGIKVKIGPKHFFQALENLVSNSIKYNHSGGNVKVSVNAKTVEEKGEKKEKIVITIADDGIGIPKEDQGKIFGKFFRASNATLKETEGSGLGLSVVKTFVEESGGKIWFESEEKKGTKFFIEFPAVKSE